MQTNKTSGFFELLALLIVAAILIVVFYNQNVSKDKTGQKKSVLEQDLQSVDAARQAKDLIEKDNIKQTEGL